MIYSTKKTYFNFDVFPSFSYEIDDIKIKKTIFRMKNYLFLIYNRYGIVIFKSESPDKGWDGKINGKNMAPEGVYTYHIQYTSFTGQKKGYKTWYGDIILSLKYNNFAQAVGLNRRVILSLFLTCQFDF
jgi:gliding motility-associated-like protein